MEASKTPVGGQTSAAGSQRGIAKAAGIMSALTLASRVAGLARDIVVGGVFGASPAADAFFVAVRIPNLFRRVVAEGAASSALLVSRPRRRACACNSCNAERFSAVAMTQQQLKRQIGQVLIDQGLVSEDQLRIALLEQMKAHLPVGRLLVQLGFVSEVMLRDALAAALGLQAVDLANVIVDPNALKVLPRDLARRHRAFRLAFERSTRKLIVALADARDLAALDRLRAHFGDGVRIELRLAGDAEIERAIEHHYGRELSSRGSMKNSSNNVMYSMREL